MQDRLNQNDVTNRVNVEDPQRVRDTVLALFAERFPGADFAPLARAFDDLAALFEGAYPGYLACDTLYHDIRHTLDMTLAMARLVHFTGYEMEIEDIRVDDQKDRLLGCMVGTADLLGQMSDRMYLEKCREFLYREFVVGAVARETLPDGKEVVRYASPEDLVLKTPGFYEYVARVRIDRKLGGVDRFVASHFDGPDLYQAEIDRNMDFLRQTIETADFTRLRRACYSLSAATRRAA